MKKHIRLLALLLSALMLVTIAAGCAGTPESNTPPASNPPASDTPSTQDPDSSPDSSAPQGGSEAKPLSLNLSVPEELNSVDPSMNASAWSQQMICLTNQGLMSFAEDGSVTYGVADSYEVSDDGLTYTFHIRDDAYWTNGAKVTAYDFLFSWTRVTDPATGSPASFALGASGVKNGFAVAFGGEDISTLGIAAPDESTFIVELDAPRSYFLYQCALASYLMPINEEYFNSTGGMFGKDINNYISCGPYIFSDWEPGGTSYSFVKNESFFDADKITADELNFTVITDSSQTMMAWDSNALDTVGLSGDYVAMYKDDPALYVSDMAAMFFLSFNTTDSNLSNQNLRMALSLAIDKQAIVDGILNNGSRVADYIIPASFAPDSRGVNFRDAIGNPTFNEMDKAKAAEYWETAKTELGVSSLTLELLYNDDTVLAAVSAFLQSEWQGALPGLTINLVQTTYNDRLARMGVQDYQIGLTRWYADYPDPSTYLDMWNSGSQMNYGKYNNERYDELNGLMNGALALKDKEAERTEVMAEMESIILGDAAICPLYQLAACALQNPDYNWSRIPAGLMLYQYTSWK